MQSTLKCARKTWRKPGTYPSPTHDSSKLKISFIVKNIYVLIWKFFLYADCVCSSLFDTIFFIIAFDGGIWKYFHVCLCIALGGIYPWHFVPTASLRPCTSFIAIQHKFLLQLPINQIMSKYKRARFHVLERTFSFYGNIDTQSRAFEHISIAHYVDSLINTIVPSMLSVFQL